MALNKFYLMIIIPPGIVGNILSFMVRNHIIYIQRQSTFAQIGIPKQQGHISKRDSSEAYLPTAYVVREEVIVSLC